LLKNNNTKFGGDQSTGYEMMISSI